MSYALSPASHTEPHENTRAEAHEPGHGTREAGLRFLVDGGRLAEVDGSVELALDGSLVGYSRSLLDVYGVDAADRHEPARIGDAVAHQRALTAVISRQVADPPERRGTTPPAPASSETTFEEVPLVDGRVVERYGVPLRRTDGSVAGRLFVVRDVTARRRAEAELRARARQQEAIAELGARALRQADLDDFLPAAMARAAAALEAGAGLHLLTLDPAGRLSERASFVGLDEPCDLPGAGVGALDPAPRMGALRAAVSSRAGPCGVLCVHGLSGRPPTPDEEHFLEALANIVSAAISRREAERALAEREREVRAVFEHAQDALLTFDDDGRMVDANPAARRLLAPGDASDRGAWSAFEAELRARWSTLRTSGRAAGELAVRSPGHPGRLLEWSAVAWILPGRHLAVLRDVTEARRVQARLGRHERMAAVGALVSGIAHGLNNPLAGIFANVAFIGEQMAPYLPYDADGAELAAAVADARSAAERMRDVIRELQDFSRGETPGAGETGAGGVDSPEPANGLRGNLARTLLGLVSGGDPEQGPDSR